MKYLIYFIGCILFALGSTFFIASNLGTDPLNVFAVGVTNHTSLSIGDVQSLIAVICLFIWSITYKFKKVPPISTFLTFFICGYLIDLFIFITNGHTPLNSWIELAIAILLCTQSSSLIIMSGFGIRAMDLLSIAFAEKTKLPFWVYKGIFEIFLFVVGWMLGGVFGAGTIAFLLTIKFLIQPVIKLNEKLGVPNYGPMSNYKKIKKEQIQL
jgi:uncharacterized membrane protein YczE